MKRLIAGILTCSFMFFTACDDKDARDYAKELISVLKSYQEQVNQKIKTEQQAYKDLAAVYSYANTIYVHDTLRLDRNEGAREFVDELLTNNSPMTLTEIRRRLQKYADKDFEMMRQLHENETDAQAQYLAELESLSLESKTIDALVEALDELSKPKSKTDRLKELGQFAQEVKSKLDDMACEDLARQIKCLEASSSSATDQAKIKAQIDKLKERMSTKQCDANKTKDLECPERSSK